MRETSRFAFLQFEQTKVARVAKMPFANSFVAKVTAEFALLGLFRVEQLNEFGTTLHTKKAISPEAVTLELRRIAALPGPEE